MIQKKLVPPPTVRGHDFSTKEINETRDSGRLLMISPCVSFTCNMRCPYCYSDSGNRIEKCTLTISDYRDIISQAKELGAKVVRIGGWGEPLMDINFYDPQSGTFPIIDYATSLRMHTVFFTNATLMNTKIANALYKKPVTVIPKIDSFRKYIQDKMTGIKGSFELIHQGIHALINAGFNNCTPRRFAISSIISKFNYYDLPGLYFFLRQWDIIPYFELIMHGGRGRDENIHVSKPKVQHLFNELLRIDEKYFGFTWHPLPPYVGFKCDKLYYNLVVDVNGDVYPCYGIKMPLGNIKHQSLKEITHTNLYWKFRNMKSHLHGKCAECTVSYCDFGCRCDAYQNGDVFGEYKMCWEK